MLGSALSRAFIPAPRPDLYEYSNLATAGLIGTTLCLGAAHHAAPKHSVWFY